MRRIRLVALAAAALLSFVSVAVASATVGSAKTGSSTLLTPSKTVTAPTAFECHKLYGIGSDYRRCLARVKVPPGSSCANPFWIETTGFDQKGDQKYLTVKVIGKNPEAESGVPWHIHLEVQVHNPRIVVCPRAELKVWVWTVEEVEHHIPGPGKLYTYFPVVEPELGGGYTSRSLTVPWGGYAAVATAHWKRS